MKFVFQREELERVLGVLDRVLPQKSALPFYQALYIGAIEGGANIRVTNGDQFLSIDVPGDWEAQEEGEGVALPGAEFIRMVRVAPGSEVSVEAGSKSAQVRSGGAEWVLHYLVGVGYGDAPDGVDDGAEMRSDVDGAAVLAALRKVQYAVSRTQNRPSFQQVLVGPSTVAADGRRAHVVSGVEVDGRYLIPEPVLEVVLELLDMVSGEVSLEMAEDGWVRIRSERVEFTTGRLAYDFPDVLDVMVKSGREQKARLRVPRQALVSAVRVADTAQDEGAVLLKVIEDKLHVEAESSQMKAQMEFGVEAEDVPGGWQRWFTSELLQEMLGAFDGEFIEFRLADSAQGVLYVEDEDECSVLMPLLR